VIGVDISRKWTSYAIVDIRGNIVAKDSFPTANYPNEIEFGNELLNRLQVMMDNHGGRETIRSIGVCAPNGNMVTGRLESPVNLPWNTTPIVSVMRDLLGMAVIVANNTVCAALGEKMYGMARGMRDFILVNIDDGVGSCAYVNGNCMTGTEGFAGELGHTCVVDEGRQCKCGHKGCLEAYTSTYGVVATAREMLEDDTRESLMRDASELNFKTVLECCEQGDELAQEVFRKTGRLLGIALANYASLFNPEAIILTGTVVKAGHFLLDSTRQSFEEHVYRCIVGRTRIFYSKMIDYERNLLAAGLLAWEVKEYSLFK
jgi:glucokinase